MSVHYKFKSALDYDTVTFDGLHISVGDLKAAISQQKRIGKTSDFDLQITNAQTKEVYVDDNTLIPKNTSLLVARVPLSQQPKKQWEGSNSNQSSLQKDVSVNKGLADLSRMEGSEQDKINAMISQSTFDYDPSNYQKIRGQNQRGAVPSNYICYKCQKKGHWIKDCPAATSGDPIEIRRSTGIPRSFMVPVDGPKAPGAMMTPSGTFAVPAVDHEAYLASENAGAADTPTNAPVAPEPTIPDELICSLCRDLLTDAVMIPCCGNSFCDECIRGALLESEDHECPDCREKEIAPTTLIPNRFLRNSVSAFRNQTGYSRRTPHRPSAAPPVIEPLPVAQPPPINGQMQPVPGPANNVDARASGSGRNERDRDRDARDYRDRGPRDRRYERDARGRDGRDTREGRDARDGRDERDRRGGRNGRDSRKERDGRRADESDGSADDNITVTVPPAHRAPHVPHAPHGPHVPHGPNVPHVPHAPHGPPVPHGPQRYGPPLGIKPPGMDGPPVNMPRIDEQRASTPTIDERRDPMSSQVLYNRGPPPYMPNVPPPSHFNPGYGRPGAFERFPPESFQPPPPGIKDSPSGHEDPLEAFNRMIREKEMRAKRREERRRAHSGSRSLSRSRTPRSPRSPRSQRSVRSQRSPRSPRSPRARPRSRGSSRIKYSRSRSASRGRLRRSPWSPRRRRTRERTLSLTRSPSPRRRHRSPLRYRSPLRSPPRSSRSPPRSPVRSPPRPLMLLPLPALSPRPMSPHRYPGVYDELLSPPRRSVDPPLGARYPPRNNGPPPGYPPIGKPVPPLIPPQNEPPPGYRGRFDGPPFEDIPPGVEPPVPGFENSPFEKPGFGLAGPIERDRLLPSNFRDPYRAPYGEGPPVYRDVAGIPPAQNEIPPHLVDHPQRFRDNNFRPPGHAFRDQGPVPFRDVQSFRETGLQQPYRDNNFRNGPPPLFRDNNYRNTMFREGNFRDTMPHNFRDSGIPFRAPSAEIRDPNAAPYNDPTFRDGYREEVNPNRDMRSGYRSNTRNRPGSRRNPNAEHERHRDGRDRDRFNDNRDQTDRNERSRDAEKRAGFEKSRETREDRVRDYERNRDEKERENRGHDKSSPDKKLRTSPKRGREPRERKRSESRGRSRDRDHRREKKDERARDKSSADRSREHKEKDKKIKDRKKKKREKEKDIEKKKKRDKKDKKEKDGVKKEDDDAEKSDTKLNIKEEINEDADDKTSNQTEHEIQKLVNSNVEAPKCKESQEVQDDLYGGEEAEAVDKEIIQNYVKNEENQDIFEPKTLDSNKEEPFDGIELQPASDELEADIEVASNNKEMLAPLPALSKWEVDDDNVEKSKEPGEITSPEEEEDSTKVTSEVLKRAENAIFAKAINSLRPIEIKKISSDRIKLYGDEGQQKNSVNNIQITVPITDQEQRMVDLNDRKRRYSKTPPPRLSVKERLGGKVDDTRRSREPRIVQSTVERVKSRSKTPKKEQTSYRRVVVEKDRSRKPEQMNRIEISKSERHNSIDGSKSDQTFNGNELKKKEFLKPKDEKKSFGDDKKVCQEKNITERKKSHERERKKSILDEAHFEPDYDENVESDNETKEESKKRERSQETSPAGPSDPKKIKIEETIKLDLANVKKKPESDSESSSDSEYSSSSSSSDARKRKKKKKRNKKKKKRAASDSDSDSDSSSDDHKKKKKKRKHKKKSSKKKKKYKHK